MKQKPSGVPKAGRRRDKYAADGSEERRCYYVKAYLNAAELDVVKQHAAEVGSSLGSTMRHRCTAYQERSFRALHLDEALHLIVRMRQALLGKLDAKDVLRRYDATLPSLSSLLNHVSEMCELNDADLVGDMSQFEEEADGAVEVHGRDDGRHGHGEGGASG